MAAVDVRDVREAILAVASYRVVVRQKRMHSETRDKEQLKTFISSDND